jgi:PAS domain S-box-containing protein
MKTDTADTELSLEGFQRFSKIAFMAVATAYLPIIGLRFLLFPAFGSAPSPLVFVMSVLAFALLSAGWGQVSKPGLFWQYLILIYTFILVGVNVGFSSEASSYWAVPMTGILFAILIGYPDGSKSDKSREVWSLSRRHLRLAALFAGFICFLSVMGFFRREDVSIEAQFLVRSVWSALSAMVIWSTAIILVQKQWRMEDVRPVLLRVLAAGLVLFAMFTEVFKNELSQFSVTDIDSTFSLVRVAGSSVILFAAFIFPRHVIGKLALLGVAIFWAAMVSTNQSLGNIPILSALGLLGLIIRFPNWLVAGSFWAVILPILGFGLDITEPAFVIHSMAATVIFASSYLLGLRLEAFSANEGIENVQPVFDRRSLGIGLAAGAAFLLIGGGLLYADYSRDREIARAGAQNVAERSVSRIKKELEERQRVADALSQLPLETIATQAEFERATDLLTNLLPNNSLGWAPQGILRFSNPLKGNEASIGLDLLKIDERKEAFNNIIATGEAHWTGPFDLARGGRGLLYAVPIFRPSAEPSRQSFAGFVMILEDLDVLADIPGQFKDYDLRLWIDDRSIRGQEARPQLIFGSADGDEAYAEFGASAQVNVLVNKDNDALEITVDARPLETSAMDTLPARLLGLLIVAFLFGGGVTITGGRSFTDRQKLREAEAFQRALVSTAGAAFIVTDVDGVIRQFNPAAEELTGYSAEDLVGKESPALFHDDEEVVARAKSLSQELGFEIEPGFKVFVERVMGSGPETREWTYIKKDGARVPVLLTVSAIIDEDANIAAYFGLARDISELKQQEQLLLDQERQLKEIFMGSGAAQVLVDKSGQIVDANEEAMWLFEYSKEELIELNVDELVPAKFLESNGKLRDEYFRQASPKRSRSERVLQARTKSGDIIDIELGLAHIRGNKQDLVLATILDITKTKLADRARTEFLSNISHDLRTPISVVIGAARGLQNEPLGERASARVKRLMQASGILLSLVNDVLDWAKIEAGELDLEHELFSLIECCETVASVMEDAAADKGVALTYEHGPDIPDHFVGDRARLQQIMLNLISNAVKFTDHGEIKVAVSKIPSDKPEKVRLRFEVRDTGIGISAESLQLLFQRFNQVDRERGFQGTGLGLSIVKQLTELMGGSVGVESELGVGSTFHAEIEFEACDDSPTLLSTPDHKNLRPEGLLLTGRHLLIVDDNALIAEELSEMIEYTYQAKVSVCTNGQKALDWLDEHHAEVDLILMDVHMPVMDGLTAVEIIRSDPVLKAIPVIAMTAGATKTTIEELIASGMDDYITKPFTQERLEAMLVIHIKP